MPIKDDNAVQAGGVDPTTDTRYIGKHPALAAPYGGGPATYTPTAADVGKYVTQTQHPDGSITLRVGSVLGPEDGSAVAFGEHLHRQMAETIGLLPAQLRDPNPPRYAAPPPLWVDRLPCAVMSAGRIAASVSTSPRENADWVAAEDDACGDLCAAVEHDDPFTDIGYNLPPDGHPSTRPRSKTKQKAAGAYELHMKTVKEIAALDLGFFMHIDEKAGKVTLRRAGCQTVIYLTHKSRWLLAGRNKTTHGTVAQFAEWYRNNIGVS